MSYLVKSLQKQVVRFGYSLYVKKRMSRRRQPTEFDLLEIYVEEMERLGKSHKLVRLSADDNMAARIGSKLGGKVALEHLQSLTDKCLAHEWLTHTVLNATKYRELSLTTEGWGIVRSRRRKAEALANRSYLKKVSDYIEDRKGLFTALGVVIAFAALFFNFIAKPLALSTLIFDLLVKPITKFLKG